MTIASELMFKVWDGDDNEYFTHMDMNRIEYNANLIADDLGVSTVDFTEVTRASQFDYSEAQRLEDLIQSCADEAGVSVTMEQYWGVMRSVSYVDFERWESSLYSVYQALGGLGERIDAGSVWTTYSAMLYASEWRGTGPYYIDIDAPAVLDATEVTAFVPHTATVLQREAEANAVLNAVKTADRRVRIYALGLRPREDIPIRMATGGLEVIETKTLSASSWSGSGPYTQTVTLSDTPVNAVVGMTEGMTSAQVIAMMQGMMHVSAISGTTLTIRAIGECPTIDVPIGIAYETEASA